jgi:hypothetical protein
LGIWIPRTMPVNTNKGLFIYTYGLFISRLIFD